MVRRFVVSRLSEAGSSRLGFCCGPPGQGVTTYVLLLCSGQGEVIFGVIRSRPRSEMVSSSLVVWVVDMAGLSSFVYSSCDTVCCCLVLGGRV